MGLGLEILVIEIVIDRLQLRLLCQERRGLLRELLAAGVYLVQASLDLREYFFGKPVGLLGEIGQALSAVRGEHLLKRFFRIFEDKSIEIACGFVFAGPLEQDDLGELALDRLLKA